MIKPPSLQSDYSLIYSGDPALVLPEDADERARLLQQARETGNWTGLIAQGQEPTLFTVAPLTGSAFAWLSGETRRRDLSQVESLSLALRLALRKVSGFGDHKVTLSKTDEGYKIANVDIIDAIYAAAGAEPVMELGAHIITKASESPSPK